jgi:hypothetical protein
VDGQLVESRKLSNPSGIELNDYDKFFVGEMNGFGIALQHDLFPIRTRSAPSKRSITFLKIKIRGNPHEK